MNTVLAKGYKRDVVRSDLPELIPDDAPTTFVPSFEKRLDNSLQQWKLRYTPVVSGKLVDAASVPMFIFCSTQALNRLGHRGEALDLWIV